MSVGCQHQHRLNRAHCSPCGALLLAPKLATALCAQVSLCEPHISLPGLVSRLYSLASRFLCVVLTSPESLCSQCEEERVRPGPRLNGQHLDNR